MPRENKTYILRVLAIYCDVKHNFEYNENKFKFKIVSYVRIVSYVKKKARNNDNKNILNVKKRGGQKEEHNINQ